MRIADELDHCSREAQDLLLTYLDHLPPARALLGTSNLQLDLLTERFQTRFQSVRLLPPATEELAEFLASRWPVRSRLHPDCRGERRMRPGGVGGSGVVVGLAGERMSVTALLPNGIDSLEPLDFPSLWL